MHSLQRVIDRVSGVFFTLAALLMLAFSLSLVIVAAYQLVAASLTQSDILAKVLEGIGLVTIAVAVFDVGKFLIEEELIRQRELRSITEARVSLTKFFSIIIIVLALEGIVLIFEVKTKQVDQLLFPTAVMGVAVLALVGLGLFRKLTDVPGPESTRKEAAAASSVGGESE
jgi:ABC-type polysaccharide/polyol phosphate export permease